VLVVDSSMAVFCDFEPELGDRRVCLDGNTILRELVPQRRVGRRHGLANGRLGQRVGTVGAVVSVSVSPNELDCPLINTSGIKTPEL
jgi:hypothetical protein